MQQCKKLLQNMKTERKEVKKVIRKNYFDTGNKQPIPLPHPETDVLDNSNFLVMPIEGTLDSDMMGGNYLSLTHSFLKLFWDNYMKLKISEVVYDLF
jgi:hypothetical protein